MRCAVSNLLILIMLFSCSNSNVTRVREKKSSKTPAWIQNRPVLPGYYTGIGVSRVDASTGNHIDVAKNNALNDLVSEISVTISSNSVFRQFENNTEFREEFESLSNASIRDNIEGYELVGSWGDNLNYWVYYRLSKSTYREVKERKLERAKSLGFDLFNKARASEKSNDIGNALALYFKSLDAVKSHLDEDLSVDADDGQIYLVNEVLSSIITIFNKTNVQLETERLSTKIARPLDSIISFRATFIDESGIKQPLKNMPFRVYFKKGKGEISPSVMTDQQGNSSFRLGRVTGNLNFQEIAVELDVKSMMEQDNSQAGILQQLISLKSTIPSGKLQLNVSPLQAIYKVDEVEFGGPSKRHALTNEVKTYLSDNFFTFTNVDSIADVKVLLDSRAIKGNYNQQHNLYTVFIDCYLSIIDAKTATKVYYKGFDQVRGQQVGSWDNSLKDAQQNTLKRVREEILPEIHHLDF